MTRLSSYSIPRIVISGLRGGSGKTILSLCLIASWRKRGVEITPFKKGPDYIDAGWLARASGKPSYNLDLFMMSPEQIINSFVSHSYNTQIAVVEGNRGIYDGVDHKGTYSTAELAKLLKAPVILIVDTTKVTNTVAAMVLGCQKIDPGVLIAGVVLNRAATNRQESVIRRAIEDKCKLPVLGSIPKLNKDPFPERHMGLTPFHEHADIDNSLEIVAELGEKYLDLDAILGIANEAEPLSVSPSKLRSQKSEDKNLRRWEDKKPLTSQLPSFSASQLSIPKLRIGVVKDSAFQFYYQENFEELEKKGAELIEISPLKQETLPDIDALYIGGGFPETHAIALADNISFKNSLRDAVEKGLPVYAECGGLMYLGKSLVLENKTYHMAGILPVVFGLEKKPQAHGYAIVEVKKENPYFPKGCVLKGHEFHYSRVLSPPYPPLSKGGTKEGYPLSKVGGKGVHFAFKMKRGEGIADKMDGLCYKNVLATYTHLHVIGSPEWADGLIRCAKECQRQK